MKRDGLYRRQAEIFAFRYKDATGSWREKYTRKTDRAEAKKFWADFLADITNGTLPTNNGGLGLGEGPYLVAGISQTPDRALHP
jgi:hypothetical protein